MNKNKSLNLIRIEEAFLNAWPSLRSIIYDGWLLRFANGYTKRANSINILGSSKIKLAYKIKSCEARYHNAGLPAMFRLTDIKPIVHIKKALTNMDYVKIEPTSVLVLNVKKFRFKQGSSFCDFKSQVLDIWLKRYFEIGKFNQRSMETHRRILKSIVPRFLLAELDYKGMPVCTGMAVLEKNYTGLFDLFTLNEKRRQGLGAVMLNGLIQWAQVNEAKWIYLQVVDANSAAINMYKKCGFKKAYSYYYYVNKSDLKRIQNPR